MHLPRAGAVSFDKRYYPIPQSAPAEPIFRTADSVRRQPTGFATIREKFRTPKTRQFVPLLGEEGALIQKLPSGEVGPLMTVSTG